MSNQFDRLQRTSFPNLRQNIAEFELDYGLGARSPQFNLSRGHLQTMIGGNYALKGGLSLDFGLIAGFRPASPRFGAQIGVSFDF